MIAIAKHYTTLKLLNRRRLELSVNLTDVLERLVQCSQALQRALHHIVCPLADLGKSSGSSIQRKAAYFEHFSSLELYFSV
jgi:hypothetical protein